MWPFKTRAQQTEDEEDFWEEEDDSQAYVQEDLGYYEDDDEEDGQSGSLNLKALFLTVGVFVYIVFLVVGAFSTDYKNGRGYVVPGELRKERSFVHTITPFYQVLLRTPTAIDSLEKENKNAIDFQYNLEQLQNTILTMQQDLKRTNTPLAYDSYENFLFHIADEEVAYIGEKIAYAQDNNPSRIPVMKDHRTSMDKDIQSAESQMQDINQRITANQH